MNNWPLFRALTGILFSLLVMTAVASTACADDAYYSGEPRLRVEGSRSVTLLKTSIRIDNFAVTIRHYFDNHKRQQAKLSFVLEAPSFGNRGKGGMYPDSSYSDLSMTLDGKRVVYTRNARAFLQNRDVTDILTTFAIQPNDVGRLENMLVSHYTISSQLRAEGLINAKGLPLWTAKNEYSFEMEAAPKAPAIFQYVYSALPGIFYIAPEDRERQEITKLMGAPWSTLQTAFGGASRSTQGFNILRIMQLPLWTDSWHQPADKLEIYITMPSVGDKNCLLLLLLDGQTYLGEGSLRLVLNKRAIKKAAWLAVYSPFGTP